MAKKSIEEWAEEFNILLDKVRKENPDCDIILAINAPRENKEETDIMTLIDVYNRETFDAIWLYMENFYTTYYEDGMSNEDIQYEWDKFQKWMDEFGVSPN